MFKEVDQFLAEIESEEPSVVDPFAPVTTEEVEKQEMQEGGGESQEQRPKNRRERRLEAKLEAERQSAIELAEMLRAEREAKARSEVESADYLKSIEKLYGTDSPEGREATELLKNALVGLEERALTRAIETLREEQKREQEEVKRQEQALDSMLEDIEDEYDVDLTSTSSEAYRRGFFKLLERMSPKDRDGNIIQYADHHAVWEIYNNQTQQKKNPAKQLSSRSMVGSSPSQVAGSVDKTTEKYLIENGFI